MDRVQKQAILRDLENKMVFIVGPRQAGKTWLAKDIAGEFEHAVYLNYDNPDHRQQIINRDWLQSTELLVLDELHKLNQWKNYLKGLYDTKPDHLKIIVTGSARLDAFKQAGDSLAGRYFVHHLLPFSPAELAQLNTSTSLDKLISHSGFPEPFCADDEIQAKRWRQEYINSLITVDVLDFEKISNLQAMKLTMDLLRRRVGSPISFKNLAEDISISPTTVKKYISILEALYIVFRVTPYSKNIARSILKEPKIYFFDTGLVEGDHGAKYENIVALSLLKSCLGQQDYLAEAYQLHYLRTKEKKEVDFALAKDGEITQLIEAKCKQADLDKNLYYFSNKYDLPAIQVVKEISLERQTGGINIISAEKFLSELYL